jgi:ferredoxin
VRVHVDGDVCSGHARCEAAAPGTYELDDQGYNATRDRELDDDEVSGASRGALACPEQAITLLHADGTPIDDAELRRLAGLT